MKEILERRSVRKYLDKDVPDEIINELIDAARHAPFGGPPIKACQPWGFIIVKDPEVKEKLALGFDDRQFLKQAPVIIAACVDTSIDKKYNEGEAILALAVQNIITAAQERGLGTCYVSAFLHNEEHKKDKEKLREVLNLPEQIVLLSLITIGYPDASEEIKEKELKEVDEIIHFGKW